jgi:hypothetical protein
MEIFCSLPDFLSFAETWRIPLASMSKVTSICGITAGGGFECRELEVSEKFVVGEKRALTLTDADVHGRLVISCGREDLRLLHRNGRVALDHGGGAAALGLNGEGERSHVEKKNVLHVALENATLNGSTDGDHFIGVHTLVGSLAGKLLAVSTTFGMRVIPPTRTSSSSSPALTPASLRQSVTGFLVREKR